MNCGARSDCLLARELIQYLVLLWLILKMRNFILLLDILRSLNAPPPGSREQETRLLVMAASLREVYGVGAPCAL